MAQNKDVGGAIAATNKAHGAGSVVDLGMPSVTEDLPSVIRTGSDALNAALGVGGYPGGRVVELYGPRGSGKTAVALHAVRCCQGAAGVAAYIDMTHTLDVVYAKCIGVNLEHLLVSQPDSGDSAIEIAEALVKSGAVDLIVVNDVQSLAPRSELAGEPRVEGAHARMMSQALRRLTAGTYKTGCTVLFVNNLDSTEPPSGGNALKFYASVRLDVRHDRTVETVGKRTRVKVAKNKCAPPFREAWFFIENTSGRLVDLVPQPPDVLGGGL